MPCHVQVLQFVHGCAAQLAEAGESAEMALQLFLTAAHSASEHARLELIAYEFFEQARTHACSRRSGIDLAALAVSCRTSPLAQDSNYISRLLAGGAKATTYTFAQCEYMRAWVWIYGKAFQEYD